MKKYVFSFVLLVSIYSYMSSMHMPCDNTLIVSDFDENQPFTVQAICMYNLPREFLQALEHPHRQDNYAGNLKDIRRICMWFYETVRKEERSAERMYFFERKELDLVNSVSDREDWTPGKFARVKTAVHVLAQDLLQRKPNQSRDIAEAMTLLKMNS